MRNRGRRDRWRGDRGRAKTGAKARPRAAMLAVALGLLAAGPASGAPGGAFAVSRFDLQDPRVVVALTFAGGQERPSGPEAFTRMVGRAGGAIAVNGTFFNVRTYETFGNLVNGGRLLQHRDWDDRGTALIIGRNRHARLQTLRDAGWPDYQDAWLVLPAGPRLLTDSRIELAPRKEGFQDPPIFRRKPRTVLGLSDGGRTLWVVTIRQAVSLHEAARTMQRLGVSDALNLDGGTSVGLATSGKVRLHPKTPLTQAFVVYDARHPAPRPLQERYATWFRESPARARSER
ncbi:hypothetical protein D3C86_373500 [compost metagenome]